VTRDRRRAVVRLALLALVIAAGRGEQPSEGGGFAILAGVIVFGVLVAAGIVWFWLRGARKRGDHR
jgi:hypothetical protein